MLDKNRKKSTGSVGPGFALGRQLTLEYYACAPDVLLQEKTVENALLKAARESGATVVSSSFHRFDPQGVSGVVIIAESHFTVHAWPEHDYAAVDIFTCGDSINIDRAVDSMQRSFGSRQVIVSSDQNRGMVLQSESGRASSDSQPGPVPASDLQPISWDDAFQFNAPWGISAAVDLYDCDTHAVRDKNLIRRFARELCRKLGQSPSDDCRITGSENHDGYSMVQPLGAWVISGYFRHDSNAVCLDLFSPGFFNPREAAEFSLSFFKGGHYKMTIAMRQ